MATFTGGMKFTTQISLLLEYTINVHEEKDSKLLLRLKRCCYPSTGPQNG